MTVPAEISIIESNAALHPRIEGLIATGAGGHSYSLMDAIPAQPRAYDLVLVATSSDSRRRVVDELLARHDVGAMVLEKVLFRSLQDLDEVGAALAQQNIPAWVNCGRRYFPTYQAGRDRWTRARPLHIAITGSSYGLASNAVHFIDLAEYLNQSPVISIDPAGLVSGSVPAKRAGCIEIFGTLNAVLENGAGLSIECMDGADLTVFVQITASGLKIDINEVGRQMTETWEFPSTTIDGPVDEVPFEMKRVSENSEIYEGILANGRCELPSYADSQRQHRLFLQAVLKHLELPPSAVCPIS